MVLGVGIDIIEVARIRGAYEKFGERFVQRILCADEVDGVQVGDHLDADLDIANGCECVVGAIDDTPDGGPMATPYLENAIAAVTAARTKLFATSAAKRCPITSSSSRQGGNGCTSRAM